MTSRAVADVTALLRSAFVTGREASAVLTLRLHLARGKGFYAGVLSFLCSDAGWAPRAHEVGGACVHEG